jgi:hypothetical protein
MKESADQATPAQLPDLHQQAFLIKNRKRLQHDGGRAWIKDGQLHEAVKGGNYRIERGLPLSERLKGTGRELLERRAGQLISRTNSYRKL